MNRQITSEEYQRILNRRNQLRTQFGDQAVNVPEYAHLSKVIKYLQQNPQAMLGPVVGEPLLDTSAGGNSQQAQMMSGRQDQQQVPQGNSQMHQQQLQGQQLGQQLGQQNQQNQQGLQIQYNQNNQNQNQQQLHNQQQQAQQGPQGQHNLQQHPQQSINGQFPPNRTPHAMNANMMQHSNIGGMVPSPMASQVPTPQQFNQQMNFSGNGNTTGNVSSNEGSAFTPQQFQLVKSQFQALKYLIKSPGSSTTPIPQSLVDFVTNERNAFPNGPYIQQTLQQPQQQARQLSGQDLINNLRVPGSQIQNKMSPAIAGSQDHLGQTNQILGNDLSGQPQFNQLQNGQQSIPQGQFMTDQSAVDAKKRRLSKKKADMFQQLQQIQPQLQQQAIQQQLPVQGSLSQQPIDVPPNGFTQGTNFNGRQVQPQQQNSSPHPQQVPVNAAQASQPISQISLITPATSIIPVLYDPQPPRRIEKLIPDKHKNNKVVIPISKPNIQVDCYELPDILGENDKDIAFSQLYTPQSRLQFPSILPEGISMQDIMNNKEVLMIMQIEQQKDILKRKLNFEESPEERTKLESELAALELLPLQKQLRGHVLSQVWFSKSLLPNSHPNFLAKFNLLSLENVTQSHELYSHQLKSLMVAQNQKHQNIITEILSFRDNRLTQLTKRRDKLNRFETKINSYHNQTAKEEQKRIERMAKQRLQALKSNDEEAYLKLLDHTKDTRITHLLKQTNQFLDSLAQAVQTQQREAHHRSVGRAGAVSSQTQTPTPPPPQAAAVSDIPEERREKMDYYHVAHRIKEEVTKQPSILVGGTLKEYQIKGLQWMVSLFNNHLNGILADEMGLGKTIQTISLLTYLIEVKKINGPFLVIVPLSTLTNWNLEFEKWAPAIKKITYKGTPNQRKVMQYDIKNLNFQILLTTFEYTIKDKAILLRIKWVHMIIDEGHRMKNASSKLSETLTHHYHTDYRLILTGTPLQNNLPELWALLNFVLPKIFNSVKSFDEWFNTPFSNTGGQDKIELSEEETLLVIRRLHKVLRPFLLRRLKKDVEKDLPNKTETVVKCKMSALQSKLYQQMLRHNILYASDSKTSETPVLIRNANNQIMQLRKICNHPFVYEEVEHLINPTAETNDQIWRVAGKFELLDKVLPKFKKTGHRVLIFFQMTQIMDIMEDFLRLRGMKYMRLDGGTKADDRTTLLKLFNAPDSDYFCFLLSTRAGGLGLNLQTADTVIIFDTDWNPHQDLQAQDRAHRIGQKNEVRILRLITEDSVEEMILGRAHAKLEIDGKVIQAGKFDNKSTAEEQEALLRALIEKEEERKLKGEPVEEEDLDDDELNMLISRNDEELITFRKLDDERIAATKNATYPSRLFTDAELPAVYKKDPEELLKKDEIDLDDYGRGNRERKATSYDDHLTEEQWLRKIDGVIDEGGDDIDEKPKKRRRGRPKVKELADSDESDAKRSDEEDFPLPEPKRARTATPVANGGSSGSVSRSASSRVQRGKGRAKPRGARGNLLYRSTPTVDPLEAGEREQLQSVMEQIFDVVMNYKNDGGRTLSDLFLVKPLKKFYPDYYVLIKNPIALDSVKKRINTRSYSLIREILEDLHLMFSNAKIYNEEGSIVYEDAAALEEMAADKFKESMVQMSEDEKAKVLDFEEFDETYSLKPLHLPGKKATEADSATDTPTTALQFPPLGTSSVPISLATPGDIALVSETLEPIQSLGDIDPDIQGGLLGQEIIESGIIDPEIVDPDVIDDDMIGSDDDSPFGLYHGSEESSPIDL